jgi:2-hydroxychromene-2-carboxylate isomerase
MTKRLEFFFDYVSPYTYLANSQVGNLGVDVDYRPMLLGAVMQATGNRPPRTVAAKGRYLEMDIARWAAAYGVPFKWGSLFPQKTVNALRVAIVAERQGKFHEVHGPLFQAVWVDDRDVNDNAVLAEIISNAGMNAEAVLEEISTDAVKGELRANTEEAVERGIFGAPTFFVGDQMFFGNDRFEFIRKELGLS